MEGHQGRQGRDPARVRQRGVGRQARPARRGASGAATGDTIPLAKEDPTTKFFGALSTFQSCLKGLGVKFIGVPDAENPNSPTNDPNYIKALSTCAAKSNIVQALKDQQTAQDNLTPAQIKTQNKGYLKWRDCMIGRGWGIPEAEARLEGPAVLVRRGRRAARRRTSRRRRARTS